jgi:hypothetical protein
MASLAASPAASRSIPYYVASVALVGAAIETIELWRWLNSTLGADGAHLVPVVLLAVLVAALLAAARRGARPVQVVALAVGIAAAAAALALPDAQFPAKRVHVAEYVAISLVVRRAVSFHARGGTLTLFTVVIGLLLGVHDELVQGLHPDRTFALADIATNGAGALAGGLIGSGLRLFEDGAEAKAEAEGFPPGLALLGGGVLLLVVALPWFRDADVPWWTVTPVLAGGLAWMQWNSRRRLGDPASVAAWLALTTASYPAIANGTTLVFH